MRKILVSTILGVGIAGTANASIVSSGFLDEKLTEYALSTSLDLKANQTDLTALSNKIGNDWPFYIEMMPGLYNLLSEFYPQGFSLENTSDLAHFLFGGALESGLYANAAGVLNFLGEKIINVGDYEFLSDKVLDRFRSLTQLTNGWTSTDGTTYLGVKDLNTKIGDLPSGSLLGLSPDSDQIYKVADGTDTPVYPANVAEMIQQLYGAPQAGHRGIIPVIGRNISDLSKSITTRIGTLPDGKTVTDMISETDAKIGTLPAGYDSVGAALTAIKGIAEDAKAAALAAIPDPKQEGSSGKFVLTVDIVGDNATYHWEKIDREGETTTTTE